MGGCSRRFAWCRYACVRSGRAPARGHGGAAPALPHAHAVPQVVRLELGVACEPPVHFTPATLRRRSSPTSWGDEEKASPSRMCSVCDFCSVKPANPKSEESSEGRHLPATGRDVPRAPPQARLLAEVECGFSSKDHTIRRIPSSSRPRRDRVGRFGNASARHGDAHARRHPS